jgi:hypothetical protein
VTGRYCQFILMAQFITSDEVCDATMLTSSTNAGNKKNRSAFWCRTVYI